MECSFGGCKKKADLRVTVTLWHPKHGDHTERGSACGPQHTTHADDWEVDGWKCKKIDSRRI